MAAYISDVFSNFSKKLKRYNQADEADRAIVKKNENETFRSQIQERSDRLKASVVATYKIFRSPYEALGTDSDRAVSIDRDQQALLKAYNLYKSVMELNQQNQDEVGSTYIADAEIFSPLAQKASYTDGGQFVYLKAWLWFEQNCQDFVPLLDEESKKGRIKFAKAGQYTSDSHDQQILNIIEEEFY